MTDTTPADPAERRTRYAAAMARRDGDAWPTAYENDEPDYLRRADAAIAVADAEQLAAATVPASVPTDEACVCGQPSEPDTLHRADGPCYAVSTRLRIAATAIARTEWPRWATGEPLKDQPLWQTYLAYADAVLAVLPEPANQAACTDPIECSHEAALGRARETNRRLNYRAQDLESELAAYRRAVAQWEISERGTYVPLRSLAVIAKAAGQPAPERWELHYERVERAEAALAAAPVSPAHADRCPHGCDVSTYPCLACEADQTALRDRIAALFRSAPGQERLGNATPGEIADAVLAVLPAPADRYRTAWLSARGRAQAYGEGILRHVADRDWWKRQAHAEATPSPPTAAILSGAADVITADAALRDTEGEHDLAEYGRELAALIQASGPGGVAGEAQQPETRAEDPARIDRIRPEFTDHASVESIDVQLPSPLEGRRACGHSGCGG
jgi:hypothetical protein